MSSKYVTRFFTVRDESYASAGTVKSKEHKAIKKLYEDVAKYANKNNLKIIKISNVQTGGVGERGIGVIYEMID